MTTNISNHIIKLIINILLTIMGIWWVAINPTVWPIFILALNIVSLFLRGVLIGVDIQK